MLLRRFVYKLYLPFALLVSGTFPAYAQVVPDEREVQEVSEDVGQVRTSKTESGLYSVKGESGLFMGKVAGRRTFVDAAGKELPELARLGPIKSVSNFRNGYWQVTNTKGITYLFDVRRRVYVYDGAIEEKDVLPSGQLIFKAGEVVYRSDPTSRRIQKTPYSSMKGYPTEVGSASYVYLVEKDGRFGLIDQDDRALLPFEFVKMRSLSYYASPSFMAVKTDGTYLLYTVADGIVQEGLLGVELERGNTFLIVSVRDKNGQVLRGLYSTSGEELVAPKFTNVYSTKTRAVYAQLPGEALHYLYDLSGRRLSEEGYAQVYPLSRDYVRVVGHPDYTEENIQRWQQGEGTPVKLGRPRKYALFDLRTGQRLTGYRYTSIRTQRGKPGLEAERDGLVGPISGTGVELPGWKVR